LLAKHWLKAKLAVGCARRWTSKGLQRARF
jgi:hypothetical protein